ncbi:ParB/RepB/Spo0J family partition protein [Pararhizobium sp. IMCC21322]|uniref:ParB/RepB/Spo0J family partition protein n=1 Tax=Pararhizobium sp. IMCC21322 TaxID=3067903 RepID=UPI0027428349|nr:ParB/RepB/Spo0J family partition protein [Pararhizobium sp. IMCC21322]
MTNVKSKTKIALSMSRDIPFNKLILSQANVRCVKAGVAIEELAADIARRTLLQSLTVRAVTDEDGTETGMFEVPAGGRRFRALELLVKQKRLNKTAPVPCVIRTEGLAEEDSLAENIQRAPLHPLDQFRAFQAMREKGMGQEEIAAAFFVSVNVVKQRLRLAAVSETLLDAYAEDEMTLDQLMAFTVNPDHERQAQVWDAIKDSYSARPYQIRRMLTEDAVRASDKRAQFIGIDAYVEAGGSVMRDLFESDDGGWLENIGLVDMLVTEKLNEQAEAIRAEGWKWIEVGLDFPYGHTYGLRRVFGEQEPLTDEQEASRDALQAELDKLEAEYADLPELPDEIDERLGQIETAIEAFDDRPVVYEAEDVPCAGAFLSVSPGGNLHIERGFVRPEDEAPVEPEVDEPGTTGTGETENNDAHSVDPANEPEEDEDLKPIPDRLVTELTAHRTVALRLALSGSFDTAFRACLHRIVLDTFYSHAQDSCLELSASCVYFGSQAPGLGETPYATALTERHEAFAGALPNDPEQLWDALGELSDSMRKELFAHCIALTANATVEAYNRRPRAIAHANRLAVTLGLDMTEAGWKPTGDAYLGRVTKARIASAVAEAKGDKAASDIESLKKDAMVERAEALLAETGWLPEPLRTPALADEPNEPEVDDDVADTGEVVSAAKDGETAMDEEVEPADHDEKEQEEELEAAE